MELLIFVPYIKDEKLKVQICFSYLPQSYKDKIEFDNPKTLNKVLQKKGLVTINTNNDQKIQSMERKEARKVKSKEKGFKPSPFQNMNKGH
jgi:hypothetical protein